MATNKSRLKSIEIRRGLVVDAMRAGFTQREIAAQRGVSVATINSDIRAITERWRERADVGMETHRANQLAQIYSIKQRAWRAGGNSGSEKYLRVLLQAIRLEAQITGTVAPPTFNFNFAVLMPIINALEKSGVPPQEAGEAFAAWMQQYAQERQQQGVQLEDNH